MYTPTLFLAAVSLLATGAQAVCDHNTHLFARQTPGQKWSYSGLTGPLNWHSLNTSNSLNTNNSLCAEGTQQTPINLDSSVTTVPGAGFVLNYPTTSHAEFENLGTTVEVLGDSINGTLVFGGKTYKLAQFHFHTPSEHRIEEEFYPMEVHFVHAAADGALAVVGFVIEIGANNDKLLDKVLPFVNQIPNNGNHTKVGSLDFKALKRSLAENPVYRYRGSLTTPPCSQAIEWIVSKKPLTVDFLTFNKAKRVMKFNSRYTQNVIGGVNLLENAKNTM